MSSLYVKTWTHVGNPSCVLAIRRGNEIPARYTTLLIRYLFYVMYLERYEYRISNNLTVFLRVTAVVL